MDFKITKINTSEKAVGMPIAVSLDEIVERMRSDKDLQAVEELAERTQFLRMDPAASAYGQVRGISKLPYLIFSALFGRQGTGDLRQPTDGTHQRQILFARGAAAADADGLHGLQSQDAEGGSQLPACGGRTTQRRERLHRVSPPSPAAGGKVLLGLLRLRDSAAGREHHPRLSAEPGLAHLL